MTPSAIDAERFAELRRIRAMEPERLAEIYAARRRRPLLADGRLFIIAADHPARGALGVGGEPMAMADRYDLLSRLALALSRPGVDGVLGTADIIDDLALLGVLDDKVVAGSMNRGGLAGAVFEMDDRFTGYSVEALRRHRLDFGKLLLRVNLADRATAATLQAAAAAVTAAARAGIPVMVEPFLSAWRDAAIRHDLTAEGVIRSIAIASGLGESSARTWLKLPVVADMDRVMAATTLPTLLLGGDTVTDTDATYARWRDALALPGVRGLVVGRTMVYPPDDDVVAAVDTAARLVHGGPSSA
jgi:hypothetical protein